MKGASEASDGDQGDNVGNEALCVIGLHGSGDKISLCLQDWEMAKVALGPGHAVPGNARIGKEDVAGSGSERACRLRDKPLLAEPVCLRFSYFVAVGTFCAWTG